MLWQLKPYKMGLQFIKCLVARHAINSHRLNYPPNTSEEEVIDGLIHAYIERYFAPWRRWRRSQALGRGFMLDFVAKLHEEERCKGEDTGLSGKLLPFKSKM